MVKHKKNLPRCFIDTSVQKIHNKEKWVAAKKTAAIARKAAWKAEEAARKAAIEEEKMYIETLDGWADIMAYEAECIYDNPDRYYSSRRSSFNDGKPGYLGYGVFSSSVHASGFW